MDRLPLPPFSELESDLFPFPSGFESRSPEEKTERLSINDRPWRGDGVRSYGPIGDHHVIDFTLEEHDPNTRAQQKHVLDCKRANIGLMKEVLGSINYEVLMRNQNAEECNKILKEKIASKKKMPQNTISQQSE
ncbi:hypothetical protein FHG87_019757 [Trinorchestia longiramus]|nr:hypothetical protein FHG87_019757 [Trinorchestia longiramus]